MTTDPKDVAGLAREIAAEDEMILCRSWPELKGVLTEAAATIERLVGEREGLAAKVYRPGVLRCAKCNFRLVSSTLHVHSGAVTPRDTTEHCPNDGAPMWRVSWEEECRAADQLWDQQFDRAQAAEQELATLKEGMGSSRDLAPRPEPLTVPDTAVNADGGA